MLALVPGLELDEGWMTAPALFLSRFAASELLAHVPTALLLTLGLVFVLLNIYGLLALAVAFVPIETSRLPPLATIFIVVPANGLLAFASVCIVPLTELTLVLIGLSTTRLLARGVASVVPDTNWLLEPAFVISALDVGTMFVLLNFVGAHTILRWRFAHSLTFLYRLNAFVCAPERDVAEPW